MTRKYGFLRKDKLLHLQSILTNMIYADELKAVYVQKDIAYKDVTERHEKPCAELLIG